jgi:hypothetical protein
MSSQQGLKGIPVQILREIFLDPVALQYAHLSILAEKLRTITLEPASRTPTRDAKGLPGSWKTLIAASLLLAIGSLVYSLARRPALPGPGPDISRHAAHLQSLEKGLIQTRMVLSTWEDYENQVVHASLAELESRDRYLKNRYYLTQRQLQITRSVGKWDRTAQTDPISFDEAVLAFAAQLQQDFNEGSFQIVNGMSVPPATSNDRAAREYCYALIAVGWLEKMLSAQPLADSKKAKPRLEVKVKLTEGHMTQGHIVFLLYQGNEVKQTELPFFAQSAPVPLFSMYTSIEDAKGKATITARGGEVHFAVESSDAPYVMRTLAGRDNQISRLFGLERPSHLAELCFEVKASFRGSGVPPLVRFSTGGDSFVVCEGLPPRLDNQWHRVSIPVDLGDATQWKKALTLFVGNLEDNPVNANRVSISIRNAYVRLWPSIQF